MVVGGRELIDTLWNVNEKMIAFLTKMMRINRYIMECKYIAVMQGNCMTFELIDTLWNVNSITAITCPDSAKRINRYIMECKFQRGFDNQAVINRINRYIMECKY